MADRPITIKFAADVAAYLRETKRMEVSTDDIAAALVGVTSDADDLERKLSRAMRDASKDVGTLEKAIRDLPDATDKAADAARKDFRRVGDDAKDAGREVGSEFRQNLGESLSSGDLEDIVGDTLGGLVSSMSGPFAAPAIAGAALAAYLWNAFKENEEAKREAISGIFEAMDEVSGIIDARARTDEFLTTYGDGKLSEGLLRVRREAESLGVAVGEYTDLISGRTTPATNQLREELQKEYDALKSRATVTGEVNAGDTERLEILDDMLREVDKQREATDRARDAYSTYQSVLGAQAPGGVVQLSSLMKGIRDDVEQTNYVMDQINRKRLSEKSLTVRVYGVDRGNRPILLPGTTLIE